MYIFLVHVTPKFCFFNQLVSQLSHCASYILLYTVFEISRVFVFSALTGKTQLFYFLSCNLTSLNRSARFASKVSLFEISRAFLLTGLAIRLRVEKNKKVAVITELLLW